MRKLLMHTCCAPCFVYIENELKEKGLMNYNGTYETVDYTAYFYNPNIHPKVEYERRKNAFIEFCKLKEVKNVVKDEYDLNYFVKNVVEQVGENKKFQLRCEYCYYIRLKKVFEYAKENDFDIVSTTLTISPYQNHDVIKKIGEKLQSEYGIEFRYVDYTSHFREGQKMARELSIYMQKYCGCIFSMDAGKWVY
ncbi:MAG: epoxyqueuosine reductase QueH [Clostridia bacterium]|nr:epoxyqueuosine reductase QueH [Clostridia bacterium]